MLSGKELENIRYQIEQGDLSYKIIGSRVYSYNPICNRWDEIDSIEYGGENIISRPPRVNENLNNMLRKEIEERLDSLYDEKEKIEQRLEEIADLTLELESRIEVDYSGKYLCIEEKNEYGTNLIYLKVTKQTYEEGDYGTVLEARDTLCVNLDLNGNVRGIDLKCTDNPSGAGAFFEYWKIREMEIKELSEEEFNADVRRYVEYSLTQFTEEGGK